MKKKILTMTLILMFFTVLPLFSQTPAPPAPGATGDTSGGSAPIGGGLFILLGLGAAYAGKKIYHYRTQGPED